MDNLTHALSGAVLSRAGLNRLTPQAGWLLVLAANVPDAEAVLGFWGSLPYLEHHRGLSHAWVLAPLLALAPLPLWRWLARRARPGRREWAGAYLVSLAGVVSHLLFDLLNTYGVRWALPFSARWYHLDWLFIFDLWIWVILGGGLAAMALGRLVSGEMGERGKPGRVGAWVVLALLAGYLGVRAEAHGRAVAVMEARVYGGQAPEQVIATPGPVNPLQWRGLVRTGGTWRVVEVDLSGEYNPEAGRVFPPPEGGRALEAARGSEVGRAFLRFARAPVWRAVPASEPEGATVVTASDLRFGDPEEGRFTAEILVDGAGRVLEERFRF